MALSESVDEFRDLHEKATEGVLQPPDEEAYRAERGRLARLLLAAQHVALQPWQRRRQRLRVACALLADIEFHDGTLRAEAFQISSGGFAALLADGVRINEEVQVMVPIPGGQVLQARARVVDVREHLGASSVSFQFLGLPDAESERVERFVFNTILKEFASA